MALSDFALMGICNNYTDETVLGAGAIKGKNCTISSITEITGGHRVTFKWYLDDGTEQTSTMDVMDGQGGGGSSDYSDLSNKPSINGVTLSGNKTTGDLEISYNDLDDKPTIPSVINYSETEQDTGLTWIDGNKLYQKTVTDQFGTVTDGTWSTLNIQDSIPSNASKAFIINAALLNNTSVGGVPIPYYKDDGTRGIKAYISNGTVRVTTNWSQYSNSKVYITIQYTKTTT